MNSSVTHYQFQIRTFWIKVAAFVVSILGLLLGLAASAAILANNGHSAAVATGVVGVVGFSIVFVVVGLALTVWTVVRSVAGLKCLQKGRPIANPTTWFI